MRIWEVYLKGVACLLAAGVLWSAMLAGCEASPVEAEGEREATVCNEVMVAGERVRIEVRTLGEDTYVRIDGARPRPAFILRGRRRVIDVIGPDCTVSVDFGAAPDHVVVHGDGGGERVTKLLRGETASPAVAAFRRSLGDVASVLAAIDRDRSPVELSVLDRLASAIVDEPEDGSFYHCYSPGRDGCCRLARQIFDGCTNAGGGDECFEQAALLEAMCLWSTR